jgi:hypothetical protein
LNKIISRAFTEITKKLREHGTLEKVVHEGKLLPYKMSPEFAQYLLDSKQRALHRKFNEQIQIIKAYMQHADWVQVNEIFPTYERDALHTVVHNTFTAIRQKLAQYGSWEVIEREGVQLTYGMSPKEAQDFMTERERRLSQQKESQQETKNAVRRKFHMQLSIIQAYVDGASEEEFFEKFTGRYTRKQMQDIISHTECKILKKIDRYGSYEGVTRAWQKFPFGMDRAQAE